ncbi:trans-aconitate 2-methyltransferase [Elysia marginata]|uniref:Trans-aconitate 2-methyltransferase n=1 Tax=Elysia marginata TaxID=1093978 RepID=A0AAV4HXB5_9GAST|nr:trans-aconitate 2-methyltransferase [Elysia marginata]
MARSSKETNAESEMTIPSLFVDSSISHHYANHRHAYSEEVFQIIIDYCRDTIQDLDLAVDVGCGPGNSTVGFTKYFKQVVGVDISGSQIALAPKHIPNCEFRVGCATNLDFLPAASADLVSCGLAFNLLPKNE